MTLLSSQFSLNRQHGSNQVVYFKIFSKVTLRCSVLNFLWNDRWFKPSSLFLDFPKNDITLLSSQFLLKRQHGSNQIVHFYIFWKSTLRCSVLNFFWKDNMVETKNSISKFYQKWHDGIQFSIFAEKRTLFKPSSLFVNFLKNDIILSS